MKNNNFIAVRTKYQLYHAYFTQLVNHLINCLTLSNVYTSAL
ncbi:hypothetical protein BH09BAC4_BH09BAC4_19210 [soil metagenome]